MTDTTFSYLAQRAAQYPVIPRRGQMYGCKEHAPFCGSETVRWLLLNTLEVNRVLAHASVRKIRKNQG